MRTIFLRPLDGRLRAGWRLLLFVGALFLAGLAASGIRHLLPLPPMRGPEGQLVPVSLLVQGLVLTSLVLGATAALCRFLERRPLSTTGLPLTGPWGRGIATGFGLGAAPIVLLVAILAALGHAEVRVGPLGPAELVSSWLLTVLALALISSLEELVLRGYGLQLLAEAGGRWFAAVVTGLLFGFMHANNPGANLLGLVNTAANGVLLAWLVMRTGSLWMACAYHAGWNITGAMILGMRLSGLDHAGGLLATQLSGPDWMTGGAYGFEGSALIGLIELVTLGLAVAFAPRLPGHPELLRFFGAPERPVSPGPSECVDDEQQ